MAAKNTERKPTLKDIIATLPDSPAEVKAPKKLSVRDAIIAIGPQVGGKWFTRKQLQAMIEAEYPALAPVAKENLDVSISRAASYLERSDEGEAQSFRFKPQATPETSSQGGGEKAAGSRKKR